MYSFFKKKKRAINSGMIVGNGITLESAMTRHTDTDRDLLAAQITSIILSPIYFVLPNVLLEKTIKDKKKLIELSAPAGFIWGNYLANLATRTFLTDLPFSLDSAIGMLSGMVIMTGSSLLLPAIYKKFHRSSTPEWMENEALLENFQERFNLGLRIGALMGLTLGGSLAFINPELGIIISAAASVIASPIVGLAYAFFPKLTKQNLPLEQDTNRLSRSKNNLHIGVLAGYLIGAMLGTFILPGLGTILGATLGGGMGGLGCYALNEVVNSPDENSWAPAILFGMRVGTVYGGATGAIIGTLLLPVIGTLLGGVIGALIGCTFGGSCAAVISAVKQSQESPHSESTEQNAETPPSFFKRAKLSVSLGAGIGGLSGAAVGTFVLPAVGTLLGAMLGAAAGATLGLAIALTLTIADCSKKAKNAIDTNLPAPKTIPTANMSIARNRHRLDLSENGEKAHEVSYNQQIAA